MLRAEISRKHNIEPFNLVHARVIALENVVFPGSGTPAQIGGNLEIIKLDGEDFEELNQISTEDDF